MSDGNRSFVGVSGSGGTASEHRCARSLGRSGAEPLKPANAVRQRLLGVVLLLLSLLMNSTVVLLPVGVPLALFAVALIAAPQDR